MVGHVMERAACETGVSCASMDSFEGIPPEQQRLFEGIPPDQQRRCISAWDAEIVALEKQLRVAKAQRAVFVAEAALKNAQAELQAALGTVAAEAENTYSLNPSAPTDCKVVHITKAMRKRARRRQRQLESQQSLQKDKDPDEEVAQSPEGLVQTLQTERKMNRAKETDTKPENSEDTRSDESLQQPPVGIVQELIASFEAKAQASVDEETPAEPLEKPGDPEDDMHHGSSPSGASNGVGAGALDTEEGLEHDSKIESEGQHQLVQVEVGGKALEPDDELEPDAPDALQPELEKFEPFKALEPDVCVGATETCEEMESEEELLPIGRWRRKGSAHQKIALGQLDDDAMLAIALQILAEDAPT